MIKRVAWSALVTVCTIRAYRGPSESPHVDDEQREGYVRPQTVGECVSYAVIQGAMLAQGITDGLKSVWGKP